MHCVCVCLCVCVCGVCGVCGVWYVCCVCGVWYVCCVCVCVCVWCLTQTHLLPPPPTHTCILHTWCCLAMFSTRLSLRTGSWAVLFRLPLLLLPTASTFLPCDKGTLVFHRLVATMRMVSKVNRQTDTDTQTQTHRHTDTRTQTQTQTHRRTHKCVPSLLNFFRQRASEWN